MLQNELQFQQTTARSLENLSETMLSLGETQEEHGGFATHLDTADRLIQF